LNLPASFGIKRGNCFPISTGTKDDENGSDVIPEIVAKELVNIVAGVATNLEQEKEHIQNVKTLCDERGWHFSDRRDEILNLLKEKQPHIVYFYCHGSMKEEELILQVGNGTEYIDGSNLRSSDILWENPRPLVFINGCETAALFPDNAIRLVNSFIRTGSAGVIGTEVTVFESLARDFAEECLRLFISEKVPIGEAVRRTRLKLLKEGNPLGLVYTPFVVPSLQLVTKPST
jgi:hypothetical protein